MGKSNPDRPTPDARLRTVAGTNIHATTDRIVKVFSRATSSDIESGARWYPEAERFVDELATLSGLTRETVAAVVAHMSPRTRWQQNLVGATTLVLTGEAPGCLSANIERARRAIHSDNPLGTLNGPKTQRFARNILGDREAVTIDVWALRVALGERSDVDNIIRAVGVYDALEHSYRMAALRLGVDPATAQSTTWIVQRNGRAS